LINLEFLKKIKIIGRGGFGRVWKVETKTTREVMAMKVMSKVRVYDKGCVSNIANELELLARIIHP
jgi:serine/threonine protein kinase